MGKVYIFKSKGLKTKIIIKNSIMESIHLNQLSFYNYLEDSPVRIYGTSEEPWFMGKDIATILGYKNTTQAILTNVDMEDR